MSATHGSSLLPAAGLVTDRAGGRRRLRAAVAAPVFADIGALTLAYAAMTLAERAPTRRHTFGLYRAEVLAAFVNAQILLVVSLFVAYEAIRRLERPVEIHTGLMLGIGTAALAGNLASVLLLARGKESSLNM